MAQYVDGFIVPVPKAKLDDYRNLADMARAVCMEYGALEYVECIAEDVQVGELTSFPRSVLLKEDEIVVFAWIIYKSRKDRDDILAKVMKDPRIACGDHATMPFDGKRMIFGGFEVLLRS